jgi:hypothetical protein
MCKHRIIGIEFDTQGEIEFDTQGEQDEYSQYLLLGGKAITFDMPEEILQQVLDGLDIPKEMLQQALDGFDESNNAEEETP